MDQTFILVLMQYKHTTIGFSTQNHETIGWVTYTKQSKTSNPEIVISDILFKSVNKNTSNPNISLELVIHYIQPKMREIYLVNNCLTFLRRQSLRIPNKL